MVRSSGSSVDFNSSLTWLGLGGPVGDERALNSAADTYKKLIIELNNKTKCWIRYLNTYVTFS